MKDNTKKGIVSIHGKSYMTVARRLELAHEEVKIQGVKTAVLQHEPIVVVQATVNIAGIEYQGISSANPAKSIEKSNPYEVAETSAVGRALGFAGYGLIESVATADDMQRATEVNGTPVRDIREDIQESEHFCKIHNKPMKERHGNNGQTWFDHRWQVNGAWLQCNGKPKGDALDEEAAFAQDPDMLREGYNS